MKLKGNLKNCIRKNKFLYSFVIKYRKKQMKKRKLSFQKYGYEINTKIYNMFHEKFEYFAIFGTLLGVIRDNGFIPYDDDLDYGVILKNQDEFIELYEIAIKNGFKFKHCFTYNNQITEMTFDYKGVNIDFFRVFENDENDCNTYSCYFDKNKEYDYNEFSILKVHFNFSHKYFNKTINGSVFICPSDYESILISNYGEDWRTPIKGIETINKVGNRQFYPNELAKIEKDFIYQKHS